MIAVAKIDAVRKTAGIGIDNIPGLGQKDDLIDEIARNFQPVDALCGNGID